MKTSKKLLIVILIISIISTSCTKSSVNNEDDDKNILKDETVGESKGEPIEDEEKESTGDKIFVRKTREKIVDPFLEKLPPYITAEDIGLYMRENIANASQYEADKMVEWLLIYQDQAKDDLMYAIEGEDYIRAFNDDMEGVFHKSKLDNIQDEFIRQDFTSLLNSFLIIDNYLDYYYYTTINWKELMEYTSYLSDDFRKIMEISKKVHCSEYDIDKFNIEELSKDIIIVEEVIKNNNSAFIEMKANDLYRSLLSTLLVGPEGSYSYHYQEKNTKEYKSLMEVKSKYPGSKLKEIISDIDLIKVRDDMDIFDIVDRRFEFGLNSDNYMETNTIERDKGKYDIMEVKMPSDIEKQNRINNIIRLNTEGIIGSLGDDKSFELEMSSYRQNHRYIFFSGFLRVTDSNEDHEYLDIYRTLDYIEERYVSLEDYLHVDFKFIQDYVEEEIGVKIENLPEFSILDTGIDLHLVDGANIGESIFLKNIGLLEYFTFEELMGNK